MLVLSRKVRQAIRIGDNIEVILLESRKGEASIGIRAPRGVPVSREDQPNLNGPYNTRLPLGAGESVPNGSGQ